MLAVANAQLAVANAQREPGFAPLAAVRHPGSPPRTGTQNGADGLPDDEAQLNANEAAVTLRRLRWSVSVEVSIVTAVLAVTAVLVNTPTARENYSLPAVATAAFNTGGPAGTGTVSIEVTPDRLGPNQLRISVTNDKGQPYRAQEIDAVMACRIATWDRCRSNSPRSSPGPTSALRSS